MAPPFNQDLMVSGDPVSISDLGDNRLEALQAFNTRLVCMTVDAAAYAEVVQGVARVLGHDACALFMHDGVRRELVLQAAVGYPGLEPGLRIGCDDPASMHAQAFSEEYLVHVDDLANQPGVKPLDPGLASALVVPLISARGPVGVFDFGSRTRGTFNSAEIRMCTMLVDQMAYSLENLRLLGELSSSRDAVIRGMALLAEIRDSHIAGHLNRICAYARHLSEMLQGRPGFQEVTPAFIDMISRAAALHDVGKVGIPDSILLKPGKLTAAEFGVMKSHTVMGAELLEGLMQEYGKYEMIIMGAEVARGHHEWWNGAGYPHGAMERDIPLAARIVAICDVYDALTSRRVYKDAWTPEETFAAMRENSGKQFDPELLDLFFSQTRELHAIRKRYPD